MDRLVPPLTAEQKASLETAVRAKVGMEFKHAGRSVRGVDCVGLIAVGLQEIGIVVQDRRAYNRVPNKTDELRQTLVDHFGPGMAREHAQPGDVLLMQWHQAPCHVALLTNNKGTLTLIHALAIEKRVVEHAYLDPAMTWERRVVGVFRP